MSESVEKWTHWIFIDYGLSGYPALWCERCDCQERLPLLQSLDVCDLLTGRSKDVDVWDLLTREFQQRHAACLPKEAGA